MHTIDTPFGNSIVGGAMGMIGSMAVIFGLHALGIDAPIASTYLVPILTAFGLACAFATGALLTHLEKNSEITSKRYGIISEMKGENPEIDGMVSACSRKGRITVRDYNRIAVRRNQIDLEKARAAAMSAG